MSAIPAAIRRLCLAVDVVGYSSRPRGAQIDVQNRLLWTMVQGCRVAEVNPARCDRQDSGDGQILILPAGVDEATVIPGMVLGLLAGLHRVNNPVGPGDRIRLRISMGQGAIQVAALGFVAPAVVAICRLLDSDELRDVLTAKPLSDAAFIVTDDLYQDMVGQGYGGLPAGGFSRIGVSKPSKGFFAEAWVQAPDPQPPLAAVPAYPDPSGLRRKQKSGAGGALVGLGTAAALAWAAFATAGRAGHGGGLAGEHHQPSDHHAGTHEAGTHDEGTHDTSEHGVTDHHLIGHDILGHDSLGHDFLSHDIDILTHGSLGHDGLSHDDPVVDHGHHDGFTHAADGLDYSPSDDSAGYGGDTSYGDAYGDDGSGGTDASPTHHGTY